MPDFGTGVVVGGCSPVGVRFAARFAEIDPVRPMLMLGNEPETATA